jgi:Zinc-binding dehydrogenase
VSIAVPRPPERESDDDRQAIWFIVQMHREQLREIGRLIDRGLVRAIVSDILPLDRGMEAYGPDRQHRGPGKVVLVMADVAEIDAEGSVALDRTAAMIG